MGGGAQKRTWGDFASEAEDAAIEIPTMRDAIGLETRGEAVAERRSETRLKTMLEKVGARTKVCRQKGSTGEDAKGMQVGSQ